MVNYAQILIIDDMPDQIALIGSILEEQGYRVFAANTSNAAKRFLDMKIPDLILLDIQMGDVSGLEICQKLKEEENTKDVPVIFLTSETSMDVVTQGFEIGGSDYITKPFAKEEFLSRVKTQLCISTQRKEFIAVNAELSQFCIAVTHDLKAPFTVINMLLEMLAKELGEQTSDNITQIMEMIMLKATQARVMIERLFEFSKMCNVNPHISEVNVKAIAEETYSDLKQLCPERNIEFSCEELPVIIADETLVRMAMKNLLQNAIKYTSKKEKAVIEITAGYNTTHYVIKVKDNGAGFDMRFVGKIFQVFERLHTDEEFQGTGVGLALVNRIMERHNGRIEAYGEVDKGAEFTLYFPKNVKISDD